MGYMAPHQGVLLIGFGGPQSMAEVRPFLDSVLAGIRIPKERYEEVVHHYEILGGASPYNALTEAQRAALEKELASRGRQIPVRAGFRHARPAFPDVFREFLSKGVRKVAGIVLSPFHCYTSNEKYLEAVETGRLASGANTIEVTPTRRFGAEEGFVSAQAERIEEALSGVPPQLRTRTYPIFCAHSIPVPMSEASGYDRQFAETAAALARATGFTEYAAAYQSRSGRPTDPWLAPDVSETIELVDAQRYQNVLLVPCGFTCDNVEVLYDLDVEARQTALDEGFGYLRAQTVMDHPRFVRLLADLAQEALGG